MARGVRASCVLWVLVALVGCMVLVQVSFSWKIFSYNAKTDERAEEERVNGLRTDKATLQKRNDELRIEVEGLKMKIEKLESMIENIKAKESELSGMEVKVNTKHIGAVYSETVGVLEEVVTSKEEVFDMMPHAKGQRMVYVVTPTYDRITQKADLTRMAQALMLNAHVYWVVIEDTSHSNGKLTHRVRKLLVEANIAFAHVGSMSPKQSNFRGIAQRNKGLDVVRSVGIPGTIYFGDDDNAYDYRIFDDIRNIKGLGVFASGFSGDGNYERCLVDSKNRSKVVGFVSKYDGQRKFKLDMGGFAFSTELLATKGDNFHFDEDSLKKGQLESSIVGTFVDSFDQLEPVGNCTQVRFWHIAKHKSRYPIYSKIPRKEPENVGLIAST
uniref:Galactosylgalactosylxylosylprotein 3-beta-glucuronosyltransferase n=1 Tax=Mucochytrium quahogii TaxID=96639 RepID=A0A7S2RPF5_9STRA|mmetsp:Transcript_7510/g.12077  ORF Transcript_7510/g.12077 Transcript_7510/m.12077 type:complete len:385 (-) Transcript_7510:51-1205(-)